MVGIVSGLEIPVFGVNGILTGLGGWNPSVTPALNMIQIANKMIFSMAFLFYGVNNKLITGQKYILPETKAILLHMMPLAHSILPEMFCKPDHIS
jgi:hypothetical protein